ncbi:MAG: putative zinc-binding protein [bacterium]
MMKPKVLVYSCSGCSSAAQMANWLAICLDRHGVAEMSCIAGVGGGVESLVRQAREADQILGIDGCPLHCVERCLERVGLRSTRHWDLSRLGVRKGFHKDFELDQAERIFRDLCAEFKGAPEGSLG